MTRKGGNETKGGFYWKKGDWEIVTVEGKKGILPGYSRRGICSHTRDSLYSGGVDHQRRLRGLSPVHRLRHAREGGGNKNAPGMAALSPDGRQKDGSADLGRKAHAVRAERGRTARVCLKGVSGWRRAGARPNLPRG